MATERISWDNGVRTSVTTRSLSPFSTRQQRGLPPRQASGYRVGSIIVPIILSVGALALIYFGGKALLSATGAIDSKYDTQLPKKNGFNPEYYKSNISRVTISTQKALDLAQKIRFASGWSRTYLGVPSNDDEEMLLGAIQSAGSEYNLSKVSDVFQKEYQVGMIAWIKDFADNDDTKAISRIIKEYKA